MSRRIPAQRPENERALPPLQRGKGPRIGKSLASPSAKSSAGRRHRKPVCRYTVHHPDLGAFPLDLAGRNAWMMDALIDAGPKGCTPITHPAPRMSAYTHNLRAMDVPIETIHEPHGGAYAGTHGRYVLRCTVTREG